MTSSTRELRALKEEKLRRLYRKDPVCYSKDVLKVDWWSKQIEIAESLATSGRVLCRASHGVGKTMVAGGLVNWCFDCYDPSITLTTAPTAAQVNDLLWKEVRAQRRGRPGLLPKAPRMETSETHFAAGFTARDANSFQGRHERNGALFFDEAVGVEGQFWDAGEGIVSGGDWLWLCIYNPTDISSRAYEEELSGGWQIIRVSALEHPNILAGLRGEAAPYPGAVTLSWVEERFKKWCTVIRSSEAKPGDVEWPPGSGTWHRPGPLFQSRVLGLWPTLGLDTVWSESIYDAALIRQIIPLDRPLEIGCDVARFGDDWTVICVRRGACVLHMERHNGWSTLQTSGRLKQLAKEFCEPGEDPKEVAIKVDDDGIGGAVVDNAGGYDFIPVNANAVSTEPEDYPNRRSELWFSARNQAEEGRMDLSRLSADQLRILRPQLLAAKWKIDSEGRRVVEPKDKMKERLGKNSPDLRGGSPDDADATNLAFSDARTYSLRF